MNKRKNGEGSFGKKTIKGNTYYFYRDPELKYTYAKTMKELQEKIKEKDKQKKITRSKEIFARYCEKWLRSRRGIISDGVYDDYESVINCRIATHDLGKMYPSEINIEILNIFLKELSEKYSKGSITKTWAVLRQVIAYGQENGRIQQFNISKVVKPSEDNCKVKKKEIPFIDEYDMNMLYEEAYSGKYGNASRIIVFIMYTGVRISEALALKWKDIAPDMASVMIRASVRRNIVRDKELNAVKENGVNVYEPVVKVTKSKDSNRTIPLPERAREVIMFAYANKTKDDDFVFVTAEGHPYNKRTVERTLQRMLKNSNCRRKDYTPHCLRHGYGSVLISKGVDIKIVSELLGHSDIAFTYNTYIGTLREDKINAVKVFD